MLKELLRRFKKKKPDRGATIANEIRSLRVGYMKYHGRWPTNLYIGTWDTMDLLASVEISKYIRYAKPGDYHLGEIFGLKVIEMPRKLGMMVGE